MPGATAFVDSGRRTTHKCYNLYCTVDMLTTLDGVAVIDAKAIYSGRKSLFSPAMEGRRRNIAITFGTEKLGWRGYPPW